MLLWQMYHKILERFFTLRLSVILLHLRGVQQRLSGFQQRTTAFFS